MITEFEKQNAVGKDLTKRLSKSKLNTFKSCPKQYWFSEYFPQEAEIVPAMVRGSELHDLFENVYKIRNIDTTKLKQHFYTLKNADKYNKEIDKFINWLNKIGVIIPESTEEKIYDKEDDVVIKYDRIDFDGKTRILWDYKSGKEHPIKEYEFELVFYVIFYEKNKHKKIDYAGIYFIDTGNFQLLKITNELKKKVYEEFLHLKELIKDYQNINTWPAKKSWKCRWCRWKNDCEVYNKKW